MPYDAVKADFEFYRHQREHTRGLGAVVPPHYRPHELTTDPPRPQDITLELLLASQTHLGHRTSLWHPGNARYIFGTWGEAHETIHIIGLETTAAHLRRACRVVAGVTGMGGLVLFVGTRKGQATAVVRAAELAGGCHLFDKWKPGTLSNGQQILGGCRQKVVDEFDKEAPGFERQLRHRAVIRPDLVVCLNPKENYVLLHECAQFHIPTIGIIDTDANPTWVTYPIPANDDSLRSVAVIVGALGRAGEDARWSRLRKAKRGLVEYPPMDELLEFPTSEEIKASERGDTRLAEDDADEEMDDMEQDFQEDDEPDAYADASGEAGGSEAEDVDPALLSPEQLRERDDALEGMTDSAEEQDAQPELSQENSDVFAERAWNEAKPSVQDLDSTRNNKQ